jgi:hypothetical protein
MRPFGRDAARERRCFTGSASAAAVSVAAALSFGKDEA